MKISSCRECEYHKMRKFIDDWINKELVVDIDIQRNNYLNHADTICISLG